MLDFAVAFLPKFFMQFVEFFVFFIFQKSTWIGKIVVTINHLNQVLYSFINKSKIVIEGNIDLVLLHAQAISYHLSVYYYSYDGTVPSCFIPY